MFRYLNGHDYFLLGVVVGVLLVGVVSILLDRIV